MHFDHPKYKDMHAYKKTKIHAYNSVFMYMYVEKERESKSQTEKRNRDEPQCHPSTVKHVSLFGSG